MKRRIKSLSVLFVAIVICLLLIRFIPRHNLLSGMDFSQIVYDEKGQLLRLSLNHDDKYRVFKPLNDISSSLIEATLLQEDQAFYWHFGINPYAFIKASWETYIVKSRRIGASTITMQVARMRYNLDSKTITGKLWQSIRAMQLEILYSKKEILEAYFNLAPYGYNIEGVGAASLIYFEKPAHDLSLPEAITLTVIPQNPTKRLPGNQKLTISRDKLFARWLLKHPEDEDKRALMNLPLQLQTIHSLPYEAPHFVNTVMQLSTKNEIVTSLNLRLQKITEHLLSTYLSQKHYMGVKNAAVLLVDTRDMQIKVLVGSADFYDKNIQGQINGATIKRSPGSTLKPFVYGLALDQGLIHPATVLKDVPHSFGNYNPENFDYEFMGPVTAKDALILSRNIPAVTLAEQLKNPSLYDFLQAAHIRNLKSASYYGLGMALGGIEISMIELAELYALLANKGEWYALQFFKQSPLLQLTSHHNRLLSPESAYLVLEMLKDTPRPKFTRDDISVAWKTGTSSAFRDAWTIGIIGPYVLTVWIGNFDNSSNPAFVGKSIAAPLFFQLIDAYERELGRMKFYNDYSDTLNLVKIPVCKASGLLPTRYCKDTMLTWFIPGKSPIKTDTIYREIAINKLTGLRTCQFNENTKFEVAEFWSSDILNIFKQARIQRRTPPAFDPSCNKEQFETKGIEPQITSPQTEMKYIIHTNLSTKTIIPFTAVADADVTTLHWFINETYLGKVARDQPFLWQAKPGKYVIRVVDSLNRSNAIEIDVRVN